MAGCLAGALLGLFGLGGTSLLLSGEVDVGGFSALMLGLATALGLLAWLLWLGERWQWRVHVLSARRRRTFGATDE